MSVEIHRIGRRLDEVRVAHGITKKIEFARKIGAAAVTSDNSSYYYQIVSGKSRCKIEHLLKCIAEFGVCGNWLLTGEGSMHRAPDQCDIMPCARGQLVGPLFAELSLETDGKKRAALAAAMEAYARAHGVNVAIR